VAAERAEAQTRGAFLQAQQHQFYAGMVADAADSDPESEFASTAPGPLDVWNAVRREREQTYMATNRKIADAGERDASDVGSGGYENVALSLMHALALDEEATLILNVRNRGALTDLDEDAVVEIPCVVDAKGARATVIAPLPDHALGLVNAVKSVERAVIEAATTGSRAAALRAFATHPLVDSVSVAQELLTAYQLRIPELSYLT
jgi:6-phospho-beta-glucosidase